MNWIDITILILLAVTTIKGLFDGFIKQVSSLLAFFLAFVFAGVFSVPFTRLLLRWFSDISPVLANVLGYIIAFLIIFVVVRLLGVIIRKVSHALLLSPVDRILGGVMGAVVGLIVISLLLNAIDWFDPESTYLLPFDAKQASCLYAQVKSIVPILYYNWDVLSVVDETTKEILVYGRR